MSWLACLPTSTNQEEVLFLISILDPVGTRRELSVESRASEQDPSLTTLAGAASP